jgi:hypothetical protein
MRSWSARPRNHRTVSTDATWRVGAQGAGINAHAVLESSQMTQQIETPKVLIFQRLANFDLH